MQPAAESLDEESRDLLRSVARPVSFEAGAVLVRHGEPARGAWLIDRGRAEALVRLPGGESLTVASLGPGDVFGEMALVELGTCTATIRAAEPVAGWFVAHEDFRAMVSQSQPAAQRLQHAITRVLAAKLAALNAKLLACDAAEDRPARAYVPADDPLAKTPRVEHASFDARAFLPRLPLLGRFAAPEIDALAALGRYVEPPRGHAIFCDGREARAVFLVVRGAVEIVAAREGKERRLAVLGPGQLAGFLAALREAPHSTSAFARETSVLLEFPADAFRAAYFGSSRLSGRLRHAVQENLLAAMARTNRALTRLVSQAQLEASRPDARLLEAAYQAQLAAS